VTLYLAGLHALGADVHMSGLAVRDDPDLLDVRIPPPLRLAMGMAHVEPETRLLAAYLAYPGHSYLLKIIRLYVIRTPLLKQA
jgi:hypothetical protein